MFSPSPRPSTPASRFRSPTPLQRRQPSGSRLRGSADRSARASSLSQMSVADDESVTSRASSAMDVDGALPSRSRSEVIFAQSEEQKVTLLAHLPAEVLQALRNTDFVSDSFAGDIDTRNNFCLVASVSTCFVWKYARLLPGPPTCYIFPCPNRYSEPEVPFCMLVSYGSSREPGLILLSPYGELRFFDSIGLGLTGGEPTNDSLLDLHSDETITGFMYAEPQTFVATSSTGRLFLLTVASTNGRFGISVHPFSLTRPQGAIERLRTGFWGEKVPKYTPGCITVATVTNLNEEGFEVWTCTEMRIVRWSVLHRGWEQFEDQEDITDALEDSLRGMREKFPYIKEETDLDLELLDIAFDAEKYLVLFASFNAGFEDESGIDTRPRRYYIVARMKKGDYLEVASIRTVPYQTISSDRANIHPRLRLMSDGQIYCVQFGDVVALVARDNDYSSILTLKSLQDRTFGCGVVDGSPEMLFMNNEVLMKVTLDIEKINSYNFETWRGTSIKSIMTQAILFGANPKNPLRFEFPPDVDEEALISGAEQLSHDVLASDPEVVQPNPDLAQQLMERRDRLRFLIAFINENAALGKMSQSSRQRLITDAEKMFSVSETWNLFCMRVNSGYDENILIDAITAYFMAKADPKYHEDVARAFFRYEARDIGDLLPYIRRVVNKIIRDYELAAQNPYALSRGIDYVLCILLSTWNFRDANVGVYGIARPMLNAWTSTLATVDTVFDLFSLSDELFTKFASDAENDVISETRRHLPNLATAVFRTFQERQEWLESPAAADKPGNENEKRVFRERFQQIRPQVLQALLKHGESKHAFRLAEQYRDFRSLVDLCHSTPPIYPFESNVNHKRIQRYIDNYKEEFTDELYLWYIEHAELRCLFEQSDQYGDYIDIFLAKHPYPSVSWVHDLGKSRWSNASATLLTQIDRTLDLETRHTMLSIGKLAQIAGGEKASTPDYQAVLDAFHDGLDYVSVHHKLIEELRAPLAGKVKLSLENQVDIIVKAIAPSLKAKTHPGLYAQFRACTKELLLNHALGVEDLIDMLTLKESTLDYGVALELVKEATNIPDARKLSAFRTVWRRIYIHDDWESITKTANRTDKQLVDRFRKTALYATIIDTLRRAYEEQGGTVAPGDLADIPDLVLPVSEASQLPTREELASRWPGHSDEQNVALLCDYENEREKLLSFDLAPAVERIKGLAVQELEEDAKMEGIVMGANV